MFMSKVICVVDDQPSLRQMIRFSLNVNGLQVLEAENGADALGKLASHDVDMLIVDWQMPEMDGLELIRRLRKSKAYDDLPIVVISCREDLNARKEARSLGVMTWLKKPFRIIELQRVIESNLGTVSLPAGQPVEKFELGHC
jgi:two-component system chemotaxis response regulator CheY